MLHDEHAIQILLNDEPMQMTSASNKKVVIAGKLDKIQKETTVYGNKYKRLTRIKSFCRGVVKLISISGSTLLLFGIEQRTSEGKTSNAVYYGATGLNILADILGQFVDS